MVNPPRFLIVCYQEQGHLNPTLQLAKRLTSIGVHVTFLTSLSAYLRMAKASNSNLNTVDGLSFSHFSDGYDDGYKPGVDGDHYFSEIRRCGSQALSDLIISGANEGRPFSCVVCNIMLPWAAQVADEFNIPSVLLWIQAATVFDIYYYYFHGYGDMISEIISSTTTTDDPLNLLELPGLPLKLTGRDLPSFIGSTNAYSFVTTVLKELFEKLLVKEGKSIVLVNTFDAIEHEALKAIEKVDLVGIGPLVPSAFLDRKDPSDTSFGVDLYKGSRDYNEWLNSKPKESVIYISFGSLIVLSKLQMEEIESALLGCGRPFLWVITQKQNPEEKKEENGGLSCKEELEKLGKIVPWCSQVEVLSNPSLGCFVTHCGWNSTLESLVCGVPLVAFPQWTDQGTNAKLIEDSWKNGLRVRTNKEGIVESHEIKKCLELVMGDEEIRMNTKKWKDLSIQAAMEGGSSDKNLKAFLEDIIQDKTTS
ncbi:phloretin 4'-O-glucosyltransferase-like [Ziziphus jujuba]|uniref:Glycosyltransferase n=1 Tax=Ziziphus jujuba TaxID=326968 RepID=A0A6P4AG06_ZIZJJ|nr:phloretin 4'-O-glucosyltransferase-like [Ziziphus jujuba]